MAGPSIVASGLGPLPGAGPRDAAGRVLDLLADELPHLPEWPDRGPWAQPVGRAAALLVDLPLEIVARHWQATARPGRDVRRCVTLLGEDLDALEEHWADRTAPLKVQVLGPWSLAAAVERRSGEVLAADPGAVSDVVASLSEGLLAHLADLRRRLGGLAQVTVQVDEPGLAALLAGSVATRSGLSRLPALDPGTAARVLGTLVDGVHAAGARTVLGTEVDDAVVQVARASGAGGWAGDLDLAPTAPLDALGAWADQGATVVAACDVLTRPDPGGVRVAGLLRERWRRWGLPLASATVVVTPPAGLVRAPRDVVPAAYREAVTVARRLRDEEG